VSGSPRLASDDPCLGSLLATGADKPLPLTDLVHGRFKDISNAAAYSVQLYMNGYLAKSGLS
jgi:hypothetical protein